MTRFRWGHFLKTRLWFVPLLFVIAGVVLSLISTAIDDGSLIPQGITGDADSARQILYLIAFSMLTLTGLVLSLVVVVVQLAMGLFSPRIVRQILQDRPSQAAIGLFAGTFAFAILALRKVKSGPHGGSVPGVAVLLAICLVLFCIVTLVWYLNHIGQSLRVAALVGWVADDTITTLENVYPDRGEDITRDSDLIRSPRPGVIFMIDHERLVALAEQADCTLELLWAVGDFVPTGASLIRVEGDASGLSTTKVLKAVAIGPERTMNQDVAYGIRMLVDIAERSLAAGPLADPTTTVQAIDRLHDILRQLAVRPLSSGQHFDSGGTLRLYTPTLTWEGYVRLAFDEIRQAGAGSPQVARRMKSALDDLHSIALPERRAALETQSALLESLASERSQTAHDREAALVGDPAGLGSAPDVLTDLRSDRAAHQ